LSSQYRRLPATAPLNRNGGYRLRLPFRDRRGTAGIAAVGRSGLGTLVLPSLEQKTLPSTTAVSVGGAGRGRAGVFPGALALGRSAGVVGVAGRRVQEIHVSDRDLHISAAIFMNGVGPPSGEQAISEVANAAPVLAREDVSSEHKLHVPGVESGSHLIVEVLKALHEFFPSFDLGLVMPGDVGAVCEVIATGFEEEARQGAENQNMPVTTSGNQSVELLQRVSEE
jgi:hypothetical protein